MAAPPRVRVSAVQLRDAAPPYASASGGDVLVATMMLQLELLGEPSELALPDALDGLRLRVLSASVRPCARPPKLCCHASTPQKGSSLARAAGGPS